MCLSPQKKIYIWSALILVGAFIVACTPVQTPIPIATSTVIPSTPTSTSIPNSPTEIPVASSTAIILSTQAPATISSILETDVEIDVAFAQSIINDLAMHLDIPTNRIQIVSVSASRWGATTLGCNGNPQTSDEITIRNILDAEQVEGYNYVLIVGNTLYEYHTDNTTRYIRCDQQETVSGEVLIAVDPLASETFRGVQLLLASELDLSTRRVLLVDMQPVTWTDTSLGCPQPEQTYTETTIQGYHIVVTVADELYIYHSDSNTVYPCPLEQSIIPAN
ncbi:MAG: hypothetical protein Phog2KO_08090 [Phototrophicaceae bacterium]